MIRRINTHEVLNKFIVEECCENEICVTFHPDVLRGNYVIIKLDDFYNSLGLIETPPSLDCFIVRKCLMSDYGLTLVELKKISSSKGFDITNLKAKFQTCLEDFIQTRFKDLFYRDYKTIKLYFVSNIEIYKRDLGLKLDTLINVRFNYRGKKIMIEPRMPHPTITNCR